PKCSSSIGGSSTALSAISSSSAKAPIIAPFPSNINVNSSLVNVAKIDGSSKESTTTCCTCKIWSISYMVNGLKIKLFLDGCSRLIPPLVCWLFDFSCFGRLFDFCNGKSCKCYDQ